MSKKEQLKPKTYSPDIAVYSFEETSAIYKTISSVLIGPLRLVMRVLHNIPLLPPKLFREYVNGLFIVILAFSVVGFIDYVFFNHWPLLVSQAISLVIAWWLKSKCHNGPDAEEEMREVEIDLDQVDKCCNQIYKRLDAIVGDEEGKE